MEKLEKIECDESFKPIIYREELNINLSTIKIKNYYELKYKLIAESLKKTVMKNYNYFVAKKASIEEVKRVFKLEKEKYNILIWNYYIEPWLYHVGASILGGELALKFGWSISISGGCYARFPIFDDIEVSIQYLLDKKLVKKIIFLNFDKREPNFIKIIEKNNNITKKEFKNQIQTVQYLDENIASIKPDIIYYRSGSKNGKLDVQIFDISFTYWVPICMVIAGEGSEEAILSQFKSIETIVNYFGLLKQKYLLN